MQTRIAILWPQGSGYLNAAINAAVDGGAQVLYSCFVPHPVSPYSRLDEGRREGVRVIQWQPDQIDETLLQAEVELFAPDIMIVSGWHIPQYMRICRAMAGRTLRLLAMDNQWEARLKQIGGSVLSRVMIAPYFDRAFVPGERQFQFARRLGFSDSQILDGLFTCDPAFFEAGEARDPARGDGFVFVGRLAPEKGLDTLLTAYRQYRQEAAADAWPLHLYGAGQIDNANVPGVHVHGFLEPDELPATMARHRALVMPSRREPWCVALQEAAAVGLPILCTTSCGAAPHLVKNAFNGYKFAADDTAMLAAAMLALTQTDDAGIAAMSRASRALGAQYHPSLWLPNLTDALRWSGARQAASAPAPTAATALDEATI